MQKILFKHQIATYQNHHHHKRYCAISIQLNPAVMDLKGPTIIIHYRWLSAIANIRNKEKFTKGTLKTPSIIGRFLWSTVCQNLMLGDDIIYFLGKNNAHTLCSNIAAVFYPLFKTKKILKTRSNFLKVCENRSSLSQTI